MKTVTYIYILFIVTMTSCGTMPAPHNGRPHRLSPQSAASTVSEGEPTVTELQFPSEILPLLEQWEEDTGRLLTTSVQFTESYQKIGLGNIGACFPDEHIIIINIQQWHQKTDLIHEMILYHELGHCELGLLAHDNRTDKYGRLLSIMNSVVLDSLDYESFHEEYIQEYLHKSQGGK